MTDLVGDLPTVALPALGGALVHFVWQGAALGALAATLMSLSRSAATRYAIGLALLAAMAALPVATVALGGSKALEPKAIERLLPQPDTKASLVAAHRTTLGGPAAASAADPLVGGLPAKALPLLVGLWLTGVVVLSLRTLAGVLLLRRWIAEPLEQLGGRVLTTCLDVQRRLGVRRVVRYCRSTRLVTPAAVGWLRPVVVLPATVLTGLTEEQLRLVVAHELAHIRRLDPLVNVLQIAVETLLFYHPAVWWLSRRIRIERELCCDDAALAACANRLEYARALAFVAGLRRAPELAMAAQHGPLVRRVARILGAAGEPGPWSRGLRATGGLLGLASALVAGAALFDLSPSGTAVAAVDREAFQAATVRLAETEPPQPSTESRDETRGSTERATTTAETATTRPNPPRDESAAPEHGLTEEQQRAFAIHGVTPNFVRGMRAAGLDPSPDELVALRIHGASPEHVAELRAAGLDLATVDDVLATRVHGVTTEFARGLRAAGLPVDDVETLLALRIHGATPDYARALLALGAEADPERIVELRIHGVTADYVAELRRLGLEIDLDTALAARIHGITARYVEALRTAGLEPSADDLVDLRIHGVTPEFVDAMRTATGRELAIDDLVAARVHGLTPEFVARARAHGFDDLDVRRLAQLKHLGVLDATDTSSP